MHDRDAYKTMACMENAGEKKKGQSFGNHPIHLANQKNRLSVFGIISRPRA
jgi:hypothetical protein